MTVKTRRSENMKCARSVLCALIATILAAGCGKQPNSPAHAEAPENVTVCLLPKLKGIAYFSSCHQGALEAAEELGNVELIYDGPTEGSAEKQAAMIEKWTLQGVDVIAVSPNAPDVLAKAMKEAREAGVDIITWDADGLEGTRSFFVNQATARDIGYGMVDIMAQDLGGAVARGQLAIVSAGPGAANQNAWIEHMTERIESTYPNLELVTIKYPGENQNQAFQDAQDLLKAYPELVGLFGISSVSFPGTAEAVLQAGRAGEVLVTGLSTPNDMKSYVKQGAVKSVVLWNTEDLGYLTVRVAEALATGKLKEGDTTFDAGRLGTRQVEGDHVLLGEVLVFNQDNIDQYDF
jgi:ABC-type sugar transport system substrate-binding protein